MKKATFLCGLILVFTACLFAQSKPDFSGNWTLDKERSILVPKGLIETVTLKVTQTEKELTIDTKTVRTPRPQNSKTTVSSGSGTAVYPLDGKEITVEKESFRGKVPAKIKGEFLSDGKLSLSASSTGLFNNVEGLSENNQVWELSDNGKTLKIIQINSTPLGDIKSEMIFTKN